MADKMADTDVSRRDYRSGGLYQRTSDWRWIGAVDAGFTASGARKRVTVTGPGCVGGCKERCHHKSAIKRRLLDKKAEVRDAKQAPSKRTVTVAKWAAEWLTLIQVKIRPSAYEVDKAAVRYIVQAIGHRKLNELEPAHVREVAAAVRRAGKSSSTALRYHGTLIRLLKAASLEGYAIPPNVLLADKPTAAVNDRQAIPLPQAARILAHVAGMPDGSRWALAFLQGLRQAEAIGLTWDAVDLAAGTLTISWQAKSLRYNDRTNPAAGFQVPDGYEARHLVGSTHLVRPKSKAGWRVQPLVEYAVYALTAWREIAPPNDHGLVWPGRTVRGQTWPRNPASDRDQFDAIQDKVGVRHPSGRHYTVHEIRHGTATLLMELGVAESVRIAIMGHSSIAVTQGYEFVDLAQSRLALEGAAERLGLNPPT